MLKMFTINKDSQENHTKIMIGNQQTKKIYNTVLFAMSHELLEDLAPEHKYIKKFFDDYVQLSPTDENLKNLSPANAISFYLLAVALKQSGHPGHACVIFELLFSALTDAKTIKLFSDYFKKENNEPYENLLEGVLLELSESYICDHTDQYEEKPQDHNLEEKIGLEQYMLQTTQHKYIDWANKFIINAQSYIAEEPHNNFQNLIFNLNIAIFFIYTRIKHEGADPYLYNALQYIGQDIDENYLVKMIDEMMELQCYYQCLDFMSTYNFDYSSIKTQIKIKHLLGLCQLLTMEDDDEYIDICSEFKDDYDTIPVDIINDNEINTILLLNKFLHNFCLNITKENPETDKINIFLIGNPAKTNTLVDFINKYFNYELISKLITVYPNFHRNKNTGSIYHTLELSDSNHRLTRTISNL